MSKDDKKVLVLDEEAVTPKEPARSDKREQPKKERKRRRFGRRIREVFSELKKVTWPSFKTVVKQTAVVLAVVAFFLVVIYAADIGLSAGLKGLTKS